VRPMWQEKGPAITKWASPISSLASADAIRAPLLEIPCAKRPD
jgi:hypothetical protein